MKCPECGKWNRAGLPHCAYCGTELPDEAYMAQAAFCRGSWK
ncbi:MAG: zinc ribbon domain-containing protein [Lachnospiraceae bacterium]